MKFVQDGIVDCAFTLQGPTNSGWAVMLPASTVRKTKLLVPASSSHKTCRQLNGSIYSGAGYPGSLGFSTQNCEVGKPRTALEADRIRRVKCYSSKRRSEATRGFTVYDTAGKYLERSFWDFSSVLCNWIKMKPITEARVRSKSIQREDKR